MHIDNEWILREKERKHYCSGFIKITPIRNEMENRAVKTESFAITLYWIEFCGTVVYGPPPENKGL